MLSVDQIRPIKDQVLVRPDPVKDITEGGIFIPETVRADNPNYYTMTGTVLVTGQGRIEDGERVPVSVKAGDRVVFGRYAGKQIDVQRGRVLMLRESEVIGLADAVYVEPGYKAPKDGGVQRLAGDKFA